AAVPDRSLVAEVLHRDQARAVVRVGDPLGLRRVEGELGLAALVHDRVAELVDDRRRGVEDRVAVLVGDDRPAVAGAGDDGLADRDLLSHVGRVARTRLDLVLLVEGAQRARHLERYAATVYAGVAVRACR